VAEQTATGVISNQDWFLEAVSDDAPALIIPGDRDEPEVEAGEKATPVRADDSAAGLVEAPLPDGDDHQVDQRPHDLDEPQAPGQGEAQAGADVNAGARRTALWLGSGVVVVAVVIVLAFMVVGGGSAPAPSEQHRATTPAVVAAPSTTNLPVPAQDQAVPFTAWTDSCPNGPGSPLALTDTSTDSAWVCSRGPQESFVDGQVLHVVFTCDATRPQSTCSYMLNAVSVTPGWVAKTPGGKDEWLQHRVVTKLQFNFFNGNQLVADPFPVETNSVHGPVSATLPTKVLASRVDVLILHTARPPAAPLPTTATPAAEGGDQPPGGLFDSAPGSVPADAPSTTAGDDPASGPGSDPVDATFAMSQLQFLGHSPN
jgi:hypothetical protein